MAQGGPPAMRSASTASSMTGGRTGSAASRSAATGRRRPYQACSRTSLRCTGALSRHLAHEERETLPLLSRTLTRAEWHGFVADQQRKSGIRGAAQLFPWLLDEASPEQAQAVLAQLPAPLRVANRRIWRPRYARHAH